MGERMVSPSTNAGTTIPTPEAARIQALDSLRGFALLGILLLNIIGFGLHSAAYFNPIIDGATSGANLVTWATVDILFEGAMRALFSILFGAGVVLFTTGEAAKSGGIRYRRNAWLLVFGLFNVMVLLWDGDVLVTYALAGFILYGVREKSARWLLTASGVLLVFITLKYLVMGAGMGFTRDAAEAVAAGQHADMQEMAAALADIQKDFAPSPEEQQAQLDARSGSYLSAWQYIANKAPDLFLFQVPVILLLDALAMMLLGMALYKSDVMSAGRSRAFYVRTALIGFSVGLVVNSFEVYRTIASDFDVLVTFAYTNPTYQFGRLGMAMGYLSVVMLVCQSGALAWLMDRLAKVGRMALTNYLSHSLICLMIFSGAGLGLVGQLDRWMLYLVVLAIWVFQLFFSHWWLTRFRFGPVEWLWRALTYGQRPSMQRG